MQNFHYKREKQNNAGFTLAELLVVVAIIAILVAIPIPVFTNRMEKAREASDISNMRAAKSAAIMDCLDGMIVLDENGEAGPYYYNASEGVLVTEAEDALPGYGQGTKAIDGGLKFDGYNEMAEDGKVIGTEAKNKIIKIMIISDKEKGDSGAGIIVKMEWVDG